MQPELEQIPDLDVHYQEPLARFTAARLGGPADILAIARSRNALLQAVLWAHQGKSPWIILGGGANVLISDLGYRGLVIINQSKHNDINSTTGQVMTESGVTLSTLARRCMKQGLQGLEWSVSVPGSVGGAVINNAGAHGSDIAHNLMQATVIDFQHGPESQVWSTDDLAFDYRHSAIKGQRGRYVVLEARLQLHPGYDTTELMAKADKFIAYRKQTQPPGASLGSMFKNPPGDYAGRLIDAAGLKGYQIGGVQVSTVHANFFINLGNGTASDYHALIEHTQQVVAERFGVQLKLEIEQIGEEFSG